MPVLPSISISRAIFDFNNKHYKIGITIIDRLYFYSIRGADLLLVAVPCGSRSFRVFVGISFSLSSSSSYKVSLIGKRWRLLPAMTVSLVALVDVRPC